MASLNVNGKVYEADVDSKTPLLWSLRDSLDMIMAVTALLKSNPKPTDDDIDAAVTNICRCGTYQQIRQAVHAAAKMKA